MYNGRELKVALDTGSGFNVVAAVQSKTLTHNRSPVDVTSDDDSGWRKLLPDPATQSVDISVEGVTTATNFDNIFAEWNGTVFSDVQLQYPDGSTAEAADGFFMGNLELTGEQDGNVAFTADFQSSGIVTRTTP